MPATAFATAVDLLNRLNQGELTSLELLELYLDRLDRFNPGLKAIIPLDDLARQRARDLADARDAERRAGKIRGPLHGLVMTVKDSFEVAGLPCTSGAKELKDYRPTRDADAVQSLINAGAVIYGKTNLPIFAGDFQTYNDLHGRTDNPWNPAYSPGGSSGGAAAALAAGLTGLELGSDIGGSLRNPANFCGVFSHKPSHGIVPSRGHIPPPPFFPVGDYPMTADIAVCGPLARSVEDLDLALDILVRPEACQRKAWRVELPPARHASLKDFKVGLWLDDPACPVDGLILDRLQGAADSLAKAGLQISEARPEINFRRSFEVFLSLLAAVMSAGVPQPIFDQWLARSAELTPEDLSPLDNNIRSAVQHHRDWMMLDGERQMMRAKWAEFFTEHDALLCPVVPVAKMVHDHAPFFERTIKINGKERPYGEMSAWAGLSGVVYLPSTVIPAGLSAEGLPIGLQIIGPYLEDKTCLALARLATRELGGFTPPPEFV